MPTPTLALKAKQSSTYVVTANYYDEDGTALDVTTMTWTLTNLAGETINSRADVAISSPTTQSNIVLSALDLAVPEAAKEVQRVLTLEGTYTSSYGSSLPLRDQVYFWIEKTVVS